MDLGERHRVRTTDMKTSLVKVRDAAERDGQWTRAHAFRAMAVALSLAASGPVLAQDSRDEMKASEARPVDLRKYVPETVSEAWRTAYEALPDPTKAAPLPGPDDAEGRKVAPGRSS